jgi:hypothetical protein
MLWVMGSAHHAPPHATVRPPAAALRLQARAAGKERPAPAAAVGSCSGGAAPQPAPESRLAGQQLKSAFSTPTFAASSWHMRAQQLAVTYDESPTGEKGL